MFSCLTLLLTAGVLLSPGFFCCSSADEEYRRSIYTYTFSAFMSKSHEYTHIYMYILKCICSRMYMCVRYILEVKSNYPSDVLDSWCRCSIRRPHWLVASAPQMLQRIGIHLTCVWFYSSKDEVAGVFQALESTRRTVRTTLDTIPSQVNQILTHLLTHSLTYLLAHLLTHLENCVLRLWLYWVSCNYLKLKFNWRLT